MSRTSVLGAAALACALFADCDRNKDILPSEPPRTASPQGSAAVAPPSAAPVVVRDEDIPVQADFEEAAEKDITPANITDQLARIEKELSPEPPALPDKRKGMR